MHLLPPLLEAMVSGAVTVRYGRIADRCGWVDLTTRTVTLNPDATPDELEAELLLDLVRLASSVRDPRPALRLVHSTATAGEPAATEPDVARHHPAVDE